MSDIFRTLMKAKPSKDKFGIGSIISVGTNESYLVVSYGNETNIRLVSLVDFSVVDVAQKNFVVVEDENYMSVDEVRKLVYQIEGTAFSDCKFDSAGLKK